jgi:hypothetical protein
MLQVKELLYNQISANGECVFSSVSQPKGSPHLFVFIRDQIIIAQSVYDNH